MNTDVRGIMDQRLLEDDERYAQEMLDSMPAPIRRHVQRLVAKQNAYTKALQTLVRAAQYRHAYRGSCPDNVNGKDARDPKCALCEALMFAEEILNAAA